MGCPHLSHTGRGRNEFFSNVGTTERRYDQVSRDLFSDADLFPAAGIADLIWQDVKAFGAQDNC